MHKREGDWLILWQNAKTVVVGLNQNTEEEISHSFVEKNSVTVVRRMTGGGAVYHDLGNLNYSFITDAGDLEQLSMSPFYSAGMRRSWGYGRQGRALRAKRYHD